MLAAELITDSIPPLKTSDTGLKALSWMDEFKVAQLPIVDNTQYLGLISDTDILDLNEPDQPLSKQKLNLSRPHVLENQHIYEVIKVVSKANLSVIPVLDDNEIYMGLIPLVELVHFFSHITSMEDPGGIMVLELNLNDYSLSHVAQIVESNDAKILSSYVTSTSDSTKLELTLKINRTDLSRIIQTFERFNYVIKATYQKNEYIDDLKDRYNSLMKYLDI